MSQQFDTSNDEAREDGLTAAAVAVRGGGLVILPTDTVYGVGADAFDSDAVTRLLTAKGRGRDMPPPVLVSAVTTMDALAVDIPEWARVLADNYWPGPLTLVLREQQSLQWDLGDTLGTVAIRMPDHDIALQLLQRTGPLAVSSANISGQDAATDAEEAQRMLGDSVEVILDAGPSTADLPSTIVDCTDVEPRFLRVGLLSEEEIWQTLRDAGHFTESEAAPADSDQDGAGEADPGADSAADPESAPELAPETSPEDTPPSA